MKAVLAGLPETVSITFPMWRDEEKHLFILSYIVSTVIGWAVRQSPYDAPDNLGSAAEVLTENLRERYDWGETGLPNFEAKEFTCDELVSMLDKDLQSVPVIMSWNRKKSPSIKGIDKNDPDTDFIDLSALARNAAHSLMLEALYTDQANK